MSLSPTETAHPSGNAFARARDERICWLLEMHPVTAAMLTELGLFPTKAKSLKRLNRLTAKKKIRLVGTVCRKTGRPEHAFCRWYPKIDQLLHEVQLTEICLRLHAGKIVRGPHVADEILRPDAEVTINGHLYYVELDRGTMSYAQLVRRFRKYEGCQQLVLWICSSPTRLEGMRARANGIKAIALFTTFAAALQSPHREIWSDVQGEKVALPAEGGFNPGNIPGQNGEPNAGLSVPPHPG